MVVRHGEDAPGVSVADVVEQLEMVSDGVARDWLASIGRGPNVDDQPPA